MTAGGGVVDAIDDACHALNTRETRDERNALIAARIAIAELIAADREYDEARREYDAKAPDGIGEPDSRTAADYARLNTATARRASALAALEESNGRV